jgi:8-oxo-dGTP pyrophosphatase MutT (NUDIX family)
MKRVRFAELVLLTKDKNEVLLQLRDNKPEISYPNYWVISGGHIEIEDIKSAVIREIKEETNYRTLQPIFFKKEVTTNGNIINEDYYFYDFFDDKQEIECREGQRMEFIAIKDLQQLQTIPSQVKLILELLQSLQ